MILFPDWIQYHQRNSCEIMNTKEIIFNMTIESIKQTILAIKTEKIKKMPFYFEDEGQTLSLNGINFSSVSVSLHQTRGRLSKSSFISEPMLIKDYIAIIAESVISNALPPKDNYFTLSIGKIIIHDECLINQKILKVLAPHEISLKAEEKDSTPIPFISLSINTSNKTICTMYSSSLDFKNDPVFLMAIEKSLSFHNISANISDIKQDPVGYLEQLNIIGY